MEHELAAHQQESSLSYARRELGATVAFFGTPQAAEHLIDGKPDVVVYSSTLNAEKALSIETLKWIRSKARLVLWSTEASGHAYRPLLDEYRKAECFDLTIGTDGGNGPVDWNTLYPVDPWHYEQCPFPKPSCINQYNLGFGGSWGGPTQRTKLLDALGDACTKRWRQETRESYAEYAEFLLRCRAVINEADAGDGGGLLMKGRVIEAGLAGCLLFEPMFSPTSKWFEPGRDYLVYDPNKPESVVAAVEMAEFPEIAMTLGSRLREKVREFHPSKFWARVLGEPQR